MSKRKEKGKPHELTDMDVQFVSLVPQGANRQTRFLMVKTGQLIKTVPSQDATQEEKLAAREARSKKYGIEILQSGSALTYPSGFPTTETMYGDPCNLKYPWGDDSNNLDLGRLRNALARFKQNYTAYTNKSSRKVVYTRIVEKALAEGIDVSFDPEDEVDALLPQDLKDRLQKANYGDDQSDDSQEDQADDNSAERQAAVADMAAWLEQAEEDVDDMLVDANISKVDDSTQEQLIPEDGAGNTQPDFEDKEKGLLRAKVAELEKQTQESRRALLDKEKALRRERLRTAKLRKGVIGSSSRLVAGENVSTSIDVTPREDEVFAKAWQSGGDLAAAR